MAAERKALSDVELRAEGRFFPAGGPGIPVQNMMSYAEWGRSAMPLEGGAP